MKRFLRNAKSKTLASVLATALLTLGLPSLGTAADQPSSGTAVIDGAYGEWDLTNDFFANMYEAGNPTKDLLSKAYLRYDCNSKTMFVLVLDKDLPGDITVDDAWPAKQPTNAWVKVRAISSSNIVDGGDDNGGSPTGNPPEFSWVPFNGVEGSTLEGYEASFHLNPGTYNIEIHVNMIGTDGESRTSSTGKTTTPEIQVTVQCDEPVPDPSIDIEKSTNGHNADQAPGPSIGAAEPVNWTYVVTNTGNVELSNVTVSDDQGVTVSCPQTTLAAGESMTCTASGTATSGQYANVGTATGDYNDTTVGDTDSIHYFGEDVGTVAPSMDIEKSTNGVDADIATGPTILEGKLITWEYVVTNTGDVELENVTVTDNQGVTVSCPQMTLAVGESMTCTATGTATSGQYSNTGTASGDYVVDGVVQDTVGDNDPSHYFGADPAVDIEKSTQGLNADSPTGRYIEVGDTVYWLYSVKNTGNVDLINIGVTDDQGVTLDCGGGEGDNVIETLPVNETKTCQGLGTATSGQYANLGSAETTYQDSEGSTEGVDDSDPSHYFGAVPGIAIEKCTAGEALTECTTEDAANHDEAPGAFLVEGDEVVWTYTIKNTGNVALSNVLATDDQGVTLDCGAFDGTLDPGESQTCTASGTVRENFQYRNEGSASGDYTVFIGPDGTAESRTTESMDPSHYFGFDDFQPSLEIVFSDFNVKGDSNEYLDGTFTLLNAANDPTVTAIGVQSIDLTIEYRTKAPKGKKWVDVQVNDTCNTDPTVPFVFEGDGDWPGAGEIGQVDVNFWCTAEAFEIPADYTAIRATVCVEIFNRYDKAASRKAGEPVPKTFCSSSDVDVTP